MDQRFAVVGYEEEALPLRVPELRADRRRESARATDVAWIAGSLEEVECGVRAEGMIVEEPLAVRRPVLGVTADPQLPLSLDEQRLLEERERSLRELDHPHVAEGPPRVGQRADHEPVPAREDLLVAKRPRARLPSVQHPGLGSGERSLDQRQRFPELERDVLERLRLVEDRFPAASGR